MGGPCQLWVTSLLGRWAWVVWESRLRSKLLGATRKQRLQYLLQLLRPCPSFPQWWTVLRMGKANKTFLPQVALSRHVYYSNSLLNWQNAGPNVVSQRDHGQIAPESPRRMSGYCSLTSPRPPGAGRGWTRKLSLAKVPNNSCEHQDLKWALSVWGLPVG